MGLLFLQTFQLQIFLVLKLSFLPLMPFDGVSFSTTVHLNA
ncbi:hypothetical protein [Dickeya dadantii]|nr:hypothetical protein [Dickeya dadantii]